MEIQFYTKNVYGESRIYLMGPAKNFVKTLTHKETVNENDLKALADLGHNLKQVNDPFALIKF